MKKFFLLVFVLALYFGAIGAHPIYISVTEVEYDSKAKAYELSIRCFADDVEKALSEWFESEVILEKEMSKPNTKKLAEYMLSHLEFSRDGKVFEESFVGFELENDVVFCYVEISVGRKALPLIVENSLLLESIPEQENIMHFDIDGNKESIRLNLKERSAQLDL